MFENNFILPLSEESMSLVLGGDRIRKIDYIDTDGDGDPDLKRVRVYVNGILKKEKTKTL